MPGVSKYLFFFIFLVSSLKGSGQEIDHWESMVKTGHSFRYLVPESEVDSQWTDPGFNDSSWNIGPGGAGYGDDDDPTVIDATISVYCRYAFQITSLDDIGALLLDVDFDDGFVAYLNGTELARFNMGEDGSPTAWNQPSDGLHEARLPQGMDPYRAPLPANTMEYLVDGENILSLEVHNHSLSSSDLSSNIFFHAGIKTGNSYFSPTPLWFIPPFAFESTHLPLMLINTYGEEIPNEPRITAHLGLVYKGFGRPNSSSDPFNAYDGQISIETRGESSLYFYPKKSYSIETQTDSGTNNNVSLLGMPVENDFVLYAPYGDKSLIRNVISYRLFEKMAHYSPRTRFIELILNNDYKGLYVLTEKIKRDRNRVDIAEITPDDILESDISGGYLLRIDKTTHMNSDQYWESAIQPPQQGYNHILYQYFDPEYDELTPDQKYYIQDYLDSFERSLVSAHFKDPATGYRTYLDIPSFIDLMILNEFTKDVDAFRLSHYFYKQKDSNGGRLVTGPPWDYNLTFGNNDFTEDIHDPSNWIYTIPNTIYWWPQVMEDPWFRNQLYCRWDELYSSVLDPAGITSLIDSTLERMGDAVSRNFERWPIFGTYVWPNHYVAPGYDAEITYMRTWIGERLNWMNSMWGGLCQVTSAGDKALLKPVMKVYPNPSDLSRTYVSLFNRDSLPLIMRLYDINGRLVNQSGIKIPAGELAYRLPDLSHLPAGIYTLEITDNDQVREMCRLIKQ